MSNSFLSSITDNINIVINFIKNYYNKDNICNDTEKYTCNININKILDKHKNDTKKLNKLEIIDTIINTNPKIPKSLKDYLLDLKCDMSNDDCNIKDLTETTKDPFIKNFSDINFILYLCNLFEISCLELLEFTNIEDDKKDDDKDDDDKDDKDDDEENEKIEQFFNNDEKKNNHKNEKITQDELIKNKTYMNNFETIIVEKKEKKIEEIEQFKKEIQLYNVEQRELIDNEKIKEIQQKIKDIQNKEENVKGKGKGNDLNIEITKDNISDYLNDNDAVIYLDFIEYIEKIQENSKKLKSLEKELKDLELLLQNKDDEIDKLKEQYNKDYKNFCNIHDIPIDFDTNKFVLLLNGINSIGSNVDGKTITQDNIINNQLITFFRFHLRDYHNNMNKRFNSIYDLEYSNTFLKVFYIIVGIFMFFITLGILYHIIKGDLIATLLYIINFNLKYLLLFMEIIIVFYSIYYQTHPSSSSSEIEKLIYGDQYYMYILYFLYILNIFYIIKSPTINDYYVMFLYFILFVHILFALITIISFWIMKETYIEIYTYYYYQYIQSFNMQSLLILMIISFVLININKNFTSINFLNTNRNVSQIGGVDKYKHQNKLYYTFIVFVLCVIISIYKIIEIFVIYGTKKKYLKNHTLIQYHNNQLFNSKILILSIIILCILYFTQLSHLIKNLSEFVSLTKQMVQETSQSYKDLPGKAKDKMKDEVNKAKDSYNKMKDKIIGKKPQTVDITNSVKENTT